MTALIRMATEADVETMTALRRAWVEEQAGPVDDGGGFEREFPEWYAIEAQVRTAWLAFAGSYPVGMLNLVEFRRMPRPGRPPSFWGYVGNAFVLGQYRDRGFGRRLLEAAIAEARHRGYVRLVLSPSERAVPLYERAGFVPAVELMMLRLDDLGHPAD